MYICLFFFLFHTTKCCSYSCSYWESTAGFWLLAVFFLSVCWFMWMNPSGYHNSPTWSRTPFSPQVPKTTRGWQRAKARNKTRWCTQKVKERQILPPGVDSTGRRSAFTARFFWTRKYYRCEATARFHTRNKMTWFIDACCYFFLLVMNNLQSWIMSVLMKLLSHIAKWWNKWKSDKVWLSGVSEKTKHLQWLLMWWNRAYALK